MAYYSVLAVMPASEDWTPAFLPHLRDRTARSNSFYFLIEGKDDLA